MAAVRLAYSKFGSSVSRSSRPPIVILHGLFGSGNNWRTLANKMAKETNRLVYAVDARNHGDSEQVDHMSFKLMCGDMVEFCREHSLEQVTLLGHSMGGKTAMVTALEHPTLVERLIVLDVSPTSTPGRGETEDLIASLKRLDISSLSNRRQADELLKEDIKDSLLRNFLLTNLQVNNNNNNNSSDHRHSSSHRWKVNLDAIEANIEGIKLFPQYNNHENVLTYSRPTLFLGGGNSKYIRSKHIPEIKRLFPNAVISHIPDTGHWLHFEKPAQFLKTVSQFINSNY